LSLRCFYNPNPNFFTEGPGSKRKEELRGCAPFGHGFWFAFISITTVGYGDFAPKGIVSKVFCTIWVMCGLIVISIVNGNFTVNINQYTSFQALDWLSKANSTIVTIDQSSTASSLAQSGYNVRPVDTVNLQAECLLFGSATDNRALAGDINAINVCYDFLLSSLSSGDLGQVRLDSLPFTEDYFVVYNGVVMNAANPYFVFAQQFGLSSVATNGYAPKGTIASVPAFEGLNTVRSTILVTVIVVFGCIGIGILASAFVLACGMAHERWWRPQVQSDDNDAQHELTSLSKNS